MFYLLILEHIVQLESGRAWSVPLDETKMNYIVIVVVCHFWKWVNHHPRNGKIEKKHPLDLGDFWPPHVEQKQITFASGSFHVISSLTWCFVSRWFRNPGSSIGDLWRYSKFMPKTPGPQPLLHRCHWKGSDSQQLVSATQQRGGFTQSPSNQLQNKFHHAFVLV